MIANPDMPHRSGVPHPFTLNDLRVHNTIAEAPSPGSARTVAGLVLAGAIAIGAFIWLDPLHLLTPAETSPPTAAIAPPAGPARPIERQDIVAPLPPVPAPKSLEAPSAPAPVVQEPQASAPAVQPPAVQSRAASKTNTAVAKASPKERAAPPVLLSKPEETADAPIVPKVVDDTSNAPKPAVTNDQTPTAD